MIAQGNKSYLQLINTELIAYPKIDYFLCESSLANSSDIIDESKLITINFWSDNLKVQKHKKKSFRIIYNNNSSFIKKS